MLNKMFQELPWYRKLEVLRAIKGWSQDEAAEKCGTGQKTYWSWEKGIVNPRYNSKRAICMAFGVDESLFDEPTKKEVS